ncbi:glutathione synthetase-like [Linepithema humile]|uniref:glutathione synthetase-like n=1 Tax=Linepithema humile TaxID=83485 RepID=UPI0006239D7A|nr:PREDICTED: glutathione synthetase-like isoform X1 [Linepithema humile]XP_012218622.1 PREDICTED: glutathione synthetase-like isoform X2 [Linepithema humile]
MSTFRLEPCIQLPLSQEELKESVDKAKDWALMHGISMRSKKNFNKDQVQILPFTLIPSSFPKKPFLLVKNVQILLNELIHKVAYDKEFLTNSLKSTVQADPFTAKLFHIYETVYKEGFSQNISLGLLRSDYLLHNNHEIKQVEINTVATSFAALATVTTQYHRYILEELGHTETRERIPENNALAGFITGLIRAWELYDNKEAIILFIVEDVTYNISDQRFHEFEICQLRPEIKIIRRSLTSLVSEGIKLGPNKELIVANKVVAVVYYRSGYELEAYPTEKEWDIRLLIERSRAIKCPSVQYHLAGTKKVQQSLAQSSVLKMFLDEKSVNKVQEIFTGLYTLDFNDDGEKAVKVALSEPNKFVLKPQREGGGNNIYNENIRTWLNSRKNSQERTAWILMDRIYPPLQKNYLIRAIDEPHAEDNFDLSDVITELGIYGVTLGDSNEIMLNTQVGHILRTKSSSENEGGIVAGIGALDSPYLIS